MLADFKKNKSISPSKKILFHSGGILILIIFVYIVIADIKIYQKRSEYLAQVESLKNQIQNLKDRNNDLKEGILKADEAEYVEKVAREELDLQKKGEKTVSFIMPQQQKSDSSNVNKSMWQAWLGWASELFKK